jgi:antitoxin PrlF
MKSGLQKCSKTANLYWMKATLTVTSRGVVTLPAKLRQALGLKADDQLIAETTPEGLLLRPAVTLPMEIYSAERIQEFDEAEADLARVLRPTARAPRARATRKSAAKRKR